MMASGIRDSGFGIRNGELSGLVAIPDSPFPAQ